MKLFTLLLISTLPWISYAQSVDHSQNIVKNQYINQQIDKGISKENSFKKARKILSRETNIKKNQKKISNLDYIALSMHVGVLNSGSIEAIPDPDKKNAKFNETAMPIEAINEVASSCMKNAHKDTKIANLCSKDQLYNLLGAVKTFADESDNVTREWKNALKDLIEVMQACKNQKDKLHQAAKSSEEQINENLKRENKPTDNKGVIQSDRYDQNNKARQE